MRLGESHGVVMWVDSDLIQSHGVVMGVDNDLICWLRKVEGELQGHATLILITLVATITPLTCNDTPP